MRRFYAREYLSSSPLAQATMKLMKPIVLIGLCVAVALVACVALAAPVEGPCVGIDLGTTYSAVGIWQKGEVQIIPNKMGKGSKETPRFLMCL